MQRVIYGINTGKLLIMGASGHGRVIADLAQQTGYYKEISFLDDDSVVQAEDSSVIGNSSYAIAHKEEYDVIVAIGNASIRRKLQEKYENAGVNIVTLIHPFSYVADDIWVDRGTVVMAGAVIQTKTCLGKGVIVNTASSIDHECKIDDYCHIAVGSHLAGNVIVGSETWIGAGTTISNNIEIGEGIMIGAGAVVVDNIIKRGTYIGAPARKIK